MRRMTRNGDANTIPSRNNVSERCLGHVATSRVRMFIIQSMALLGVKRVPKWPDTDGAYDGLR